MGDTFKEIDAALEALGGLEGEFEPAIAAAFPAIAPFLGLFRVAVTGVDLVAKATGHGLPTAITEVTQHNTPGQRNSPTLS